MSSSRRRAATRSTEPAPRLLAAYRRSRYEVCGVGFRIGRRCRALDDVIGTQQAVLIAAANPGRRLPASRNAARETRLLQALRRLSPRDGLSGDGAWRERQFLVHRPPAAMRRLARCFGQRALVGLRRGEAPRLVLLR